MVVNTDDLVAYIYIFCACTIRSRVSHVMDSNIAKKKITRNDVAMEALT